MIYNLGCHQIQMKHAKENPRYDARAANFGAIRLVLFSFPFLSFFFSYPYLFLSIFIRTLAKKKTLFAMPTMSDVVKGGGPAGPRGLLARRRRICSFGIRALSVLLLIQGPPHYSTLLHDILSNSTVSLLFLNHSQSFFLAHFLSLPLSLSLGLHTY